MERVHREHRIADTYYGDPNFVKVPMQQLLSDQYTEMRRKLIDQKKASLDLRPGDPYTMKPTKPPTRAPIAVNTTGWKRMQNASILLNPR